MTTKVEYLESMIERRPNDYIKRAELVSAYLEEGRLEAVQNFIDETLNECECDWSMVKEFHRPVVDSLIDAGEIEAAEPIILHANKEYPDEEKVKSMVNKAKREHTKQMSASVFPPHLTVSEWWEGPHLLSEKHLDEWIPGQVVQIDEDDIVTIHVASLDEYGMFEEDDWTIPLSNLKECSENNPPDDDHLYSFLEIGIYFDSSVKIRFHKDKE